MTLTLKIICLFALIFYLFFSSYKIFELLKRKSQGIGINTYKLLCFSCLIPVLGILYIVQDPQNSHIFTIFGVIAGYALGNK
ncbi:hypothetical protein SAMN02745702_02224 [Desulfobaculum bizertense DSM 18034]|uniref:Uncharacterized protein n=1 Tax=Desulfobaculum bizertense DSM 18034 TaxID=1121442 RepID=A0A1T4WI99_9BACT|nr:hypothetical protein SAMN02745702_02224 [Desulfobaculum bizertense DSM 18034]